MKHQYLKLFLCLLILISLVSCIDGKFFVKIETPDGKTKTITKVSQNKIWLEQQVIDTVVVKFYKFLQLEHGNGLRITDLTNKMSIESGNTYNNQIYKVKNKFPLNYNNSQYQELVIISYSKNKHNILMEIMFPIQFQTMYAKFIFIIKNNKISTQTFNYYIMDDWNGYLDK